MKIKKIFSILLCMFIMGCYIHVYAEFPDVESDGRVVWAKDNINSMAEMGYIKGYPDGNFMPFQSVSKIESLILLARVLGAEEISNAHVTEVAMNLYKNDLQSYNIAYKKEVSFLLYNDVLKPSELSAYISDSTKDTKLKRYEAAILLAKLLGGEYEIKEQAMVVSSFQDGAQIPTSAKGYVEYVKINGIMQGMDIDEASGDPIFEPQTEVSRAQVATMLANLLPVLDRDYYSGVVSSIDVTGEKIIITNNGVNHTVQLQPNSVLYIDGKPEKFDKVVQDSTVNITYIYGIPRIIDVTAPVVFDEFEGIFADSEAADGGIKISVQDIDNSSQKKSYILSKDCAYQLNDINTYFGEIKSGNYVIGYISGGKVVRLKAYSKLATVSGIIEDIISGDITSLSITLSNGSTKTYTAAAGKTVPVIKNKVTTDLRSLNIGDDVTMNLEYNRIVKVTATSTSSKLEGIIEEILISKTPSMTININNKSENYYVSPDVTITLDSTTTAALSDLRPGSRIKFTAESQTITHIETTSAVSINRVEGVITSVDTSFRYLKLTTTDTATGQTTVQEVLVDANAVISDIGSTTKKLMADLKVGQTILAFGSNVTGNFRANDIKIMVQP